MELLIQRKTARFCVTNTRKQGHYSSKCPEGNNKVNTQGIVKKDLSMITCFKYEQREHYARRCTKEGTPGL
jgi:hypothetical protein